MNEVMVSCKYVGVMYHGSYDEVIVHYEYMALRKQGGRIIYVLVISCCTVVSHAIGQIRYVSLSYLHVFKQVFIIFRFSHTLLFMPSVRCIASYRS